MASSPFEPPASEPEPLPSVEDPVPIFTPPQVAVAAFLGTPLAGGALLALNYASIGRTHRAWSAAAAGLALTLGVIGLSVVLDELAPRMPTSAVTWMYVYGLYAFTRQAEGGLFARLALTPAGRRSWWAAVGVGFAGLAVIGTLIAALWIGFELDL